MKAVKQAAVKTVSLMMVISLAGKILGLVRDMLYSYNFGTNTMESAAFAMASSLPRNFLDAVFASVITASFIPVFKEAYENDSPQRAESLSNSFITLILLFSGIISLLLVVFSGGIADLLCGGYDAPTRLLTSVLLRIMFPMIVFSGIAFSLTGILHCMGEFNIPAAMSVSANVIIIIYYLFFVDRFGIKGLAWVFLAGWASQVFVQIPFLVKSRYKFRFQFDPYDRYMKKIYRLIIPVMIGTWAQPVNLTVNGSMATYAGKGASSALYFSNSLFTIITGVFVLSVSNLVFPELSRLALDDDKTEFANKLNSTLRVISFILLPMSAGLIILCKPVIRIVFERGLFTQASTDLTSRALIMYSTGMLGYGFQVILTRGFYALKDGKTPLYTSFLAIALNTIAGFALLNPMGVGGPALASSISISVVGILLLRVMSRRFKGIADKVFFMDLLKMFCSAIIMAGSVFVITKFISGLSSNDFFAALLTVCIGTPIGLVIYLAVTKLLKIKESELVFGFLKKFIN